MTRPHIIHLSFLLSAALLLSACQAGGLRLPWQRQAPVAPTPSPRPRELRVEWGIGTSVATIQVRPKKSDVVSEFIPLYFSLKNDTDTVLTGVKIVVATPEAFFVRGSTTASLMGSRFSPTHEFTFSVADIPPGKTIYPNLAVYSFQAGKGDIHVNVLSDQKNAGELPAKKLEVVEKGM